MVNQIIITQFRFFDAKSWSIFATLQTIIILIIFRFGFQKFNLKLLSITRNSPTNPEVPGKPEFAIANNIIKAAK